MRVRGGRMGGAAGRGRGGTEWGERLVAYPLLHSRCIMLHPTPRTPPSLHPTPPACRRRVPHPRHLPGLPAAAHPGGECVVHSAAGGHRLGWAGQRVEWVCAVGGAVGASRSACAAEPLAQPATRCLRWRRSRACQPRPALPCLTLLASPALVCPACLPARFLHHPQWPTHTLWTSLTPSRSQPCLEAWPT